MILADKIINERKRCGWSQEELAEKLSVSRQSVSKWEGAQSVPDLNKIIKMADIFGVSTDYLLKDEIETTEYSMVESSDSDSIPPLKKISMEDANRFMRLKKEAQGFNSIGVVLCILSPVVLIALGAVSEYNSSIMSETIAAVIGIIVLFIMVCTAIFIFATLGNRDKEFNFLYKEDFETEYGVTGMLLEKKAAFENQKNMRIAIGVLSIIISAVPVVVASLLNVPDYVATALVILILIVVAGAVYNFVNVGAISGPIEVLLQEGEFSHNGKLISKKLTPISSAYWCLVTAIFLGYSFITGNWNISWIVWPVGGVFFVVVRSIAMMIMKLEE